MYQKLPNLALSRINLVSDCKSQKEFKNTQSTSKKVKFENLEKSMDSSNRLKNSYSMSALPTIKILEKNRQKD